MQIDLQVWLDHFEYHAGRRCVLPARTRQALTAADRRMIARSIASFQRREQSKGDWLIRAARHYQRAMNERRSPLARAAAAALLHAAFTGASVIIWLKHRRVLRAAGYEMSSFLRACAAQFAFYLEPPSVRGGSQATTGLTALAENG